MYTNERVDCRLPAGLFCIGDFRQKQGSFARREGKSMDEQKANSKTVRVEPLQFQPSNSLHLDDDIFSSSEALLPALAHVPQIAAADRTVLITGEAGTGTELVARAIHRLSHRSSKAFVRVNCAEVSPHLLASRLGLQKRSLSPATQPRPGRFNPANGGTIFLEGIGELSPEAQLTLLRILQAIEGEPADGEHSNRLDVRVIAATDRDLQAATADGTFLSDLFDRLNGIQIKVPALRERKEDIPILARYFLTRHAGRTGKTLPNLTRAAMDLLKSYSWPHNMRELQSVMELVVVLCEAEDLSADAKWMPGETIPARTFARSIPDDPPLSGQELLGAALAQMLAVIPSC